jgi:hypothetical protein
MNCKKPMPLTPLPMPKRCPVCGKSSYSLAGIHPQCAASRADAPRRLQLAAEKKARTKKPAERTWEKTCPNCDIRVPARNGVCECGFDFMRVG